MPAAGIPQLNTQANSLDSVINACSKVLLGKPTQIKLSLACLLADGHLLIEDVPGVGKTTLAQTLAKALGLEYARIQFTSDMLPGDVIGTSVYNRNADRFDFHAGPIFNQVVLADEINRSTPKTQSALLEAMEERQVSIDGLTRPLPSPFFVIATQNPLDQVGTFPLPESQLDRFLMRISLGYPDERAEQELLAGRDRHQVLAQLAAVLTAETLREHQIKVEQIHVSETLLKYVRRLLEHTRHSGEFELGLSPRAGLGIVRAARAWAMLNNRDYVLPEDVQQIFRATVEHRLHRRDGTTHDPVGQMLNLVPAH